MFLSLQTSRSRAQCERVKRKGPVGNLPSLIRSISARKKGFDADRSLEKGTALKDYREETEEGRSSFRDPIPSGRPALLS